MIDSGNGGFVYEPEVDANGNPVFEAVQTPVYVALLDSEGNLLLDSLGNPLFEQATDPVTGELLFTTEQKAKLAVFNDLFGGSFDIATNGCSSYNTTSACTVFTREVSSVPEASTLGLAMSGLLVMGLATRRRRANDVALTGFGRMRANRAATSQSWRQTRATAPKGWTAAALAFALKVVEQRAQITDGDVAQLHEVGFGDEQVVEILAQVALNLFTNYINVALDVPVDFPKVALV